MTEGPDAHRRATPGGEPPGGRALTDRLAFRLAAALCLGAAAILVSAGVLNVSLQREHMTELVRTSADRAADLILRSTRAAMLENAPEDVQRILDDLGAQKGIERIRIFDKQGGIRKSTLPAEVGTMVDKKAEQCFACHREDRPLEGLEGGDRVRTFTNGEGTHILSVILPIRNQPDCSTSACHAHPASQQVLGVLDVQLSLATVDAQLVNSERQMAFGLAATVGAVLVLSGLLVWWLVLRPVRRLREAIERVASGDLSTRTEATSPDELGEMARSWNDMVRELARARDELEGWSRTLESRVDAARKELGTAHDRMLVSEKMASLGRLAAVVAHELNNPLAGIATYARLLRRRMDRRADEGGPPRDEETARALDLVETEARRCGDIVRNLLMFSRSTPSRVAAEDLRPVLDRCAALVRHPAELLQVDLRVETPPDLPKVECDAAQVQQAVLALAMNGMDAMPGGGTLTLSVRPDGDDAVVVAVADTGTGIAPDVLPHVFEPFFTTKEQGKGVGLGLAVVYGIVQRHHGRIDVDTAVGMGTTFRIRLPLAQPAAVAAAAAAAASAPTPPPTPPPTPEGAAP